MPDPALYRFDLSYPDLEGRFRLALAQDSSLVTISMAGRGSGAGLEAFLDGLDACRALLHPGERVTVLADLVALEEAPLRTQIALGRWMLTHRDLLDRVAIAAHAGWTLQIARAVFLLAGVDSVAFVDTVAEARVWLGAG